MSRKLFSDAEKMCLEELIIKYKLNLKSSIVVRRDLWARLVEEFNSIEFNNKRTEAQLKKCWDNLKTRKKTLLTQEQKEQIQTGAELYYPKPGPSQEDTMPADEALSEESDVELKFSMDSDSSMVNPLAEIEETEPATLLLTKCETVRDNNRGRPGFLNKDYSANRQQIPETPKTRSKEITEEFELKRENYEKIKQREEELHSLMVAERKWLIKAAEEKYKKAAIETKIAEEILLLNKIKREEAEINLNMRKNYI